MIEDQERDVKCLDLMSLQKANPLNFLIKTFTLCKQYLRKI